MRRIAYVQEDVSNDFSVKSKYVENEYEELKHINPKISSDSKCHLLFFYVTFHNDTCQGNSSPDNMFASVTELEQFVVISKQHLEMFTRAKVAALLAARLQALFQGILLILRSEI